MEIEQPIATWKSTLVSTDNEDETRKKHQNRFKVSHNSAFRAIQAKNMRVERVKKTDEFFFPDIFHPRISPDTVITDFRQCAVCQSAALHAYCAECEDMFQLKQQIEMLWGDRMKRNRKRKRISAQEKIYTDLWQRHVNCIKQKGNPTQLLKECTLHYVLTKNQLFADMRTNLLMS